MREKSTSTYTIEVSVVEVYNNEIRDLLTFDQSGVKHDVYTSQDGSMEITSVSTKSVGVFEIGIATVVSFGWGGGNRLR